MSNSLGSVVVELSANVAKFQSDMGKAAQVAEDRLKQIDKSVGLVKNSLMVLGASAIAGLTFDKIKDKILGVIDAAAGLQGLSERTGVAVGALSALSGVAKLSDTDTESLAGGLQKLSKAMIDAGTGGAASVEAFRSFGISLQEIKGQSADQVFLKLALQQDKYADGAGKVAAITQILGKSGANLLPVLKDLADVGELQAKTTDAQAKAADEYEKNLKRLQASSNGLYKTIGLELIPVFDEVVRALLTAQQKSDGLKKSVNDLAKDHSIRDWAQDAALAAAIVIEVFQAIGKAAYAVQGSFKSVYADIAVGGTFIKNGGILGLASKENRDELSKALDDRNKIVGDANKAYEDLWNFDSRAIEKDLKARFAASNAMADFAENADAKDLRARNSQAGPAERAQVNFNPNIGLDKENKDDPAKKILEGKLKAQEALIASERNILQGRQQYIDFFAGLEYTTLADAERAKQALIADNLAVTQAAYDKEIADLTVYIARAAKLRDKEDGKNKREEVVRKRAEAEIQANKDIGDSQNKLLEIQRKFDLTSKEQARQNQITNDSAQFQIDLMGKSSLAVQQLMAAKQIQLALEERIYQLRKQDGNADTSEAEAEAAAQILRSNKLIEASYTKQTSATFGASEAFRKYGEDAANVGQQIEGALTNAFRGAEDALVNFAMTGKLSFGDLAKSILADLARIQAKNLVTALAGDGKSGAGGLLGSLFSSIAGARADGGPVNGGSSYLVGERGPEIFTASSSGTIIPNESLQGGGSEPSIIINQTNNIDSRTDQSTIMQMMERNKAQTKAEISREMQRSRTAYSRA